MGLFGTIAKATAVGILGATHAVTSGLTGAYKVAAPVASLTGEILSVGAKAATDASKTVLKTTADAASSMMK